MRKDKRYYAYKKKKELNILLNNCKEIDKPNVNPEDYIPNGFDFIYPPPHWNIPIIFQKEMWNCVKVKVDYD